MTRPPGTRPSRSSPSDCHRSSTEGPRRRRGVPGQLHAHILSNTIDTRALHRTLARATSTRQHGRPVPQADGRALMFGTGTSVPVPDIDRIDHLLMLGANPLAFNGSLMTAPDIRGRLRAIRARGGKIVVIDPRRTRTAAGGRRAPLHPPGHRRTSAVRARGMCCSRRGWPTRPRGSPRCHRPRRGPVAGRAVHARGRRRRLRHRGRRDPPHGARTGGRADAPPSTAGSEPAPRSSARSRAGSSMCSTSSPATSTARAARCSPRARPAPRTRAGRPQGPRRAVRAVRQPRARAWRAVRRAARRLPGRRDRHARRGSDPRPDHRRRQPGALDAEQRPP